jgi:serine/threonine protein kinase
MLLIAITGKTMDAIKGADHRRLGRYEVIRKIAKGGMAEVYLAKSSGAEGVEKRLVIKTILPEFAQNPRFMAMFVDEARIAMSLNHPNIVQTYDFGYEDGIYFIAMEYVEGNDLATILSLLPQGERLALGDALYIAIEVCRGLDYAHKRQDTDGRPLNIVHCDISPHNTMVSLEGVIKIVDFGISRAVRHVGSDEGQMPMGKYHYMSPEQALDSPIDHRADVFSATALLYELLTNRPLYDFKTYAEVYNAARSGALPDFELIEPSIPFDLKFVLEKGLDRIASRRFQSIRELQLELYKILKSLSGIYDAQTLSQFLNHHIAYPSYSKLSLSSIDKDSNPLSSFSISYEPSLARKPEHRRSGSQAWDDIGVDELFAWIDIEDIDTDVPVTPQEFSYINNKVAIAVAGYFKATVAGGEDLQGITQQRLSEIQQLLDHLVYKNNAWLQSFDEKSFVIIIGAHIMSVGDAQRAVVLAYDILEASTALWADSASRGQYSICISQVVVNLRQEPDLPRARQASFEDAQHAQAIALARAGKAGEITITSKAYYRILHHYEVEPSTTWGTASEAINLFRIVGTKNTRQSQASALHSYQKLYGRDLQLKELHDAMMRVQILGVSQAISFEGIPGIGKSVIVEEFLRSVTEEHANKVLSKAKVVVFRALGLLRAQTLPYSTLKGMFLELLEIEQTQALQQNIQRAETRIAQRLGVENSELLQTILLLLEQLLVDTPDENAYTAIEVRQNAMALVQLIMKTLQDDAVSIFFVDDLQYVDVSTIDFFTQLYLNSPKPFLLITTSTPIDSSGEAASDCLEDSFLSFSKLTELDLLSNFAQEKHSPQAKAAFEDHQIWRRFLSLPGLHRENIHSLGDADAKALLHEQLANIPLDDSMADEILSRAAGIPFFIVEIVEALREQEALSYADGRYTLSSQAFEGWTPASVVSIVGEAVDRLSDYLRNNLRLLSILGREFTLEDALYVFGERISVPLRELTKRRWLKEIRNSEEPQDIVYIFTQQIAFEILDYANENDDFIPLQKKLAHYYASQKEKGREISNEAIATHFKRAGELEEALEYYTRSARVLRKKLIPTEAVRVCYESLELADFMKNPNKDSVFELLSIQNWAYLEIGEHEKHKISTQRLHNFAIQSKDPKLLAQITINLASNHFSNGNYRQTGSILRKLISQIQDKEEYLPELVAATYFYTTTLCYQGKADEALALLDRLIHKISPNDSAEVREAKAKLHKSKADALCYLAEFENAAQHLDAAKRFAKNSDFDSLMKISRSYCNIELGRFDLVPYQEMLADSHPKSSVLMRKHVGIIMLLAYYNLRVGNYAQAEEMLNRVVKMSRYFQMLQAESFAWLLALRTQIERKNFKKAFKMLNLAEKSIQKSDNIYLISQTRIARAELSLFDKKNFYSPEVALKHAMAAVSIGQSTAYPLPFIRGYHLATLAYIALDQTQTAVKMSKSLAPYLIRHRIELSEIMLYSQAQLLKKYATDSEQLAQQLIAEATKIVNKTIAHIPTPEERNAYQMRSTIERILNYSQ